MKNVTYRKKILIIDEKGEIPVVFRHNLENEGYFLQTINYSDIRIILDTICHFVPNLLLIFSDHVNGLSILAYLKNDRYLKDAFVVFISSSQEEFVEVDAFESGADDYVCLPIKPKALAKRIDNMFKNKLNPYKFNKESVINNGLSINHLNRTLVKNGKNIELCKKEFELILFMSRNANKCFTREDLLLYVWEKNVYVIPRTIDVHIRNLRSKIGPGYIKTVKGIGYCYYCCEQV